VEVLSDQSVCGVDLVVIGLEDCFAYDFPRTERRPAADRVVLLLNTLLLMAVAFLPFATSVLAGALRSGHGQRTAVVFYGMAFDVTALTFNAVWQYARRHGLLGDALDPAGATAISRRFQLALAWLTTGALLGALLPVLGVVVIAAFNAFYWLPIRGESPRPQPS
jgi:TMEM175 potassium channel family protein